jgi:hypothetical protein
MSTPELQLRGTPEAGATPESAAPRARLRGRVMTLAALAVFIGGTVAVIAVNGLILSRDWLLLWVLLGLLALSISDVKRWVRGVVFDWLPFAAFLVFYDLSRFFSEQVNITPHVAPQIQVDRWLLGDPIPTVRLQHALYHWPHFSWYDYPIWAVYMTHFFATLVVAALLWRFAYPRFRQFRIMVITLAGAGFLTYVLFPAVPPWMASNMHQLEHTRRVISDTWQHLGVNTANALVEGHSDFFNQVAAVPSMHAAYPLLFLLFFWAGTRWWVRGPLAAYVLAMAFVLVYSAEHYVADIVLGWIYAVAVFWLVTALGRRRARRRAETAERAPPAIEPVGLRAAVQTGAESGRRD